MDKVRVVCPSCGKRYKVNEDSLEREVTCRECGRHFYLAVSVIGGTDTDKAPPNHPTPMEGENRVERGSMISPDQFGSAIQEAFGLTGKHILNRLKGYISNDEKVLMAFSLSGISCVISIIRVSLLPVLFALISLLMAVVGDGEPGLIVGFAFWIGVAAVLGLIAFFVWRNTGFVLTNSRMLGRRGILKVRWVFLTRDMVNAVEINTGILERIFGLETLTIRAINGYIVCRGISTEISQKVVNLISIKRSSSPV